ncbi:hypothetical protein [Rhodopseudomonas palustris]|uniref:hypothetical protein n=1 Tax=Rhodopseudomonas palustris TaxID=1076 RepID=UPI0012EEAED1|nr:hypothetical protein [Rhodopseudomonas palustris]
MDNLKRYQAGGRDDEIVADGLRLTRLFIQITDREERLKIIAAAQDAVDRQAEKSN